MSLLFVCTVFVTYWLKYFIILFIIITSSIFEPLYLPPPIYPVFVVVVVTLICRYGEPLYIILYLFGAAVALGMVSILAGVLANSESADPVKMDQEFHLEKARYKLHTTYHY